MEETELNLIEEGRKSSGQISRYVDSRSYVHSRGTNFHPYSHCIQIAVDALCDE
jgi:hypothetical protein